MAVASSAQSSAAANLLLLLSLSTASKVIAKQGKRVQLDGAFQCRTCGRRFATFQALGGHRTSHKRPRVRADGLELLLGAHPGKGTARPTHRCDTCGKVFPTGQALGGHMRRHRPAGAVAATSSGSSCSVVTRDDENDAPSTLFQFI